MRLRVLYRTTGRENLKQRPPYYSKRLCLASFLRSLELSYVDHEIVFLTDTPIDEERMALMRAAGEVVELPERSDARPKALSLGPETASTAMARSYLAALELAQSRPWPDTDVVYLAEDDYLYRAEALTALITAVEQISEASYYSLYATTRPPFANQHVVAGEQWCLAESTTSTFGTRVGVLRSDRWRHTIPWFLLAPHLWPDESICQACQGIRPLAWTRVARDLLTPGGRLRSRVWIAGLDVALNVLALRARLRPHLLVGPISKLAMHLELEVMPPGGDWEEVASEVDEWLQAASR